MKIDWKADGEIKEITLDEVNGSNVDGFPMTSGFTSKTTHNYVSPEFMTTDATQDVTIKYNTKVTDKNDKSTNREITITFTKKPSVTPPAEYDYTKTAELGFNAHKTLGSSYSVSENKVYLLAAAKAASDKIDFICYYGNSNKATVGAPADADSKTMFSDATNGIAKWTKANSTKFYVLPAGTDGYKAGDWWDANIDKATTDLKAKQLGVGSVVIFQTEGGTKGAFVVDACGTSNTGSIKITLISKK